MIVAEASHACSSIGSLPMFMAIRRASSRVSRLAAVRRPGSSSNQSSGGDMLDVDEQRDAHKNDMVWPG
jgi:hypothetical protein